MAQVVLNSIQWEESFGSKGTGLNLVLTEALNKFSTVTSAGAVGTATAAIGIIAPDTGVYESKDSGHYRIGEVVRTFRKGWATVDRVIAVGTKIRLGAAGILDDAGTGTIVGEVFNSATTEVNPGTSTVYIEFPGL